METMEKKINFSRNNFVCIWVHIEKK